MEINKKFTLNSKKDFLMVQKALAGDQKAYAGLMKRYKDSIYQICIKIVNNKEDAMDLTVETFAKAFDKLPNYQSKFAFTTWLFRIATNNCIDFLRKKKLETIPIEDLINEEDNKYLQIGSHDPTPEELSIKKQQTTNLKLLVENLPSRHRNLIILHYFDDLTYEEISQQLSLPMATVRTQLYRARYLLGRILNSEKTVQKFKLITRYFPELTEAQQKQFAKLNELYNYWNGHINVISRNDIDELYERHILHSLGIAKVVQFLPGECVLDVGTGGGFPGIPLAIMFPETDFYLVDSIAKKILVVNEVVTALGLTNVKSNHIRAEKIEGKFNFVVSRAVTRLVDFYPWVKKKFLKKSDNTLANGILYLKGGDLTEEIAESGLNVESYDLKNYFKEEFFETKKVIYIKG